MSKGFKQTSSTEDLQTANNHIKKKKNAQHDESLGE